SAGWTNHVVNAGEVGAVQKVESFRQELQLRSLSKPEGLGETQIKVDEVRPDTSIAPGADWTVIGGVTIAIHVSARQQVEWMGAGVAENRRQLPSTENLASSSSCQNASRNYLMTLIKTGETALACEIGVVEWTKVAVEVGCRIEGFAEGVVPQQAEVVAKPLLYFQSKAMVDGRPG